MHLEVVDLMVVVTRMEAPGVGVAVAAAAADTDVDLDIFLKEEEQTKAFRKDP